MLDWAIEQKDHPVAIRVPVGPLKETGQPDQTDYSILNKNQVTQEGSQVAIFGLGNFYGLTQEVAKTLEDQHGIKATLVNPKFITGLDKELLDSLSAKHQLVVTLEDGLLEGGYGQTIASYLGNTDIKVQNYGIDKHFHDRYDRQELMAQNGLSVDTIVKNILQTLAN